MSQTFDPNPILFIHPSHPSMRRRRYLRRFRAWMRALALLILLCLIYPAPAVSETLRLASYTAALERNAPGLLYRDILYGKSSQIRAALRLIATIKPDVLALQRFDWDAELRAARAFQSALKAQGWEMQNLLAPRPNTGVATGVDIDGNGQIGGPGDAQSYGIFAGQRGLLLLSRLPFDVQNSQDHSQVLWAEVPQTQSTDPPEIAKVQRLAYVAMLQTSITWRQHPISLLTFHASPPVFDGPEDRNGRRNADEIAYAAALIDQLPHPSCCWPIPILILLMARGTMR